MAAPPRKYGRKLLVATVGLATVSYVVACGSTVTEEPTVDAGADTRNDVTSGNLVAPDTGTPPPDVTSGNLVPPDTAAMEDTATTDSAPPFDVSSGNLVPPDSGM
jgi:hypothetical protein